MQRLLVKAFGDVYLKLSGKYTDNNLCHCAYYYPFLFKEVFRQLGQESLFIGQEVFEDKIITEAKEDDILFFWGLESFVFDREYSLKLLKEHKGKKVLYITCQSDEELIKYFDYIFATEWEGYKEYYQTKYPDKKVFVVPFASPLFSFIDEVQMNPYQDDSYKIIYTGIITQRSLGILNKLADLENLYVGGIYAPPSGSGCRKFTHKEVRTLLNPKIKLIIPNGNFFYGYHFPYLKFADLGLNFFPNPNADSKPLSSKIIDYLVCGLPVVSEEGNVGNFRLDILKAGTNCKWDDFNDLQIAIMATKFCKLNKQKIKQEAREIFNPLTVGQTILKEVL